jgi:hypothetical protein
MSGVVRFYTKLTPCGCTVEHVSRGGRTKTKRFRNGYASSELSAAAWIREQVNSLVDFITSEDLEMPAIEINGEAIYVNVWVAEVQWDDESWERVADDMSSREQAIDAARSFFATQEIQAQPFRVFVRPINVPRIDRYNQPPRNGID